MTLGEVIQKLRVEQRVSQHDLARGIITGSELSRFENNEKKLDKIIISALFQRLGKTFDKLECQVSIGEYRMVLLREQLINCLENRNEKLLKSYIEQYEKIYKPSHRLNLQFLLLIKASKEYLINQNNQKCIELLQEAIEVTLPEWKDYRWYYDCLCIQEIQIITMIAYMYLILGNVEAETLIKLNIDFINKHYTDMEERTKILTPAYWVYIRVLLEQNKNEEAETYCRLAKENLTQIGMVSLMDRFLKIETELTENEEKKSRLYGQYKAIQFVKEIIQKEEVDEFFQILKTNHQQELYLSYETIKDVRVAMNISQEELSWEICANETLSRAEGGERPLSRKNRELLCEKLHIDPNLYTGNVVSIDYDVHRLTREFARLWYKKDIEKACQVMNLVESQLDMHIPMNRQYIEHWRILTKAMKQQISYEEAVEGFEKILCYTMRFGTNEISRVPSRTELRILISIATFYKRLKQDEKTIEIYQKILNIYEKSEVEEIHHVQSLIIIYLNYSVVLEENNRLDEAEKYAIKAIKLSYECGRADTIGTIIANMSCIYNKEKNSEKVAEYVTQAINLLTLYKHDKDVETLKAYFHIK